MTKKELYKIAARYSQEDWGTICRDSRAFCLIEKEPDEAEVICHKIIEEKFMKEHFIFIRC